MTTNLQATPPVIVARARPLDVGALMDECALAVQLGVSRSTVQSWRYNARGPRFIKIGRLVRYYRADVDAFLLACAQGASEECASGGCETSGRKSPTAPVEGAAGCEPS